MSGQKVLKYPMKYKIVFEDLFCYYRVFLKYLIYSDIEILIHCCNNLIDKLPGRNI